MPARPVEASPFGDPDAARCPLAQNLNIDKTKWYKFDASKLTPEAIPFDLTGVEAA